MADKTLTKLSLFCSIAGIVVLYAGTIQARPGLTPIASIDENMIGMNTMISGQVIDLHESYNGHLFVRVKDSSGGAITVPVFSSVRESLKDNIELLDNVRITGEVELYNNELELLPRAASDITVIHAPYTSITDIDNELLGELVKIRAEITERRIVGSGSLLLTLSEGNNTLVAFVPASVANEEMFPEVHTGYTARVSGLLQEYDGELELKVEDPANIGIIEAS